MVICALNGVFIISMMVITIVNTFELDALEGRTYIVTSKVAHKKAMRAKSSTIFNLLMRTSIRKKKGIPPSAKELVYIKKQIREFKRLSK